MCVLFQRGQPTIERCLSTRQFNFAKMSQHRQSAAESVHFATQSRSPLLHLPHLIFAITLAANGTIDSFLLVDERLLFMTHSGHLGQLKIGSRGDQGIFGGTPLMGPIRDTILFDPLNGTVRFGHQSLAQLFNDLLVTLKPISKFSNRGDRFDFCSAFHKASCPGNGIMEIGSHGRRCGFPRDSHPCK